MTAGPDHATYVAHGAAIDKIKDGHITALAVPHASTADLGWVAWRGDGAGRTGLSAEWTLHRGAFPNRPVEADGQIWFTDLGTNHIGRITPTGHLVLYPLAGGPVGITAHGGYLYSALYSIGKLAQSA